MKEKIVDRLVSIKSIVTITLTVLFSVLAIKGVIDGDKVHAVYLIIIGFYFGTQYESKIKKESEDANEDRDI